MAFAFSPSVNKIERDLNTSVPAVPTTITGIVGSFEWGPCNVIVDVDNDKELVDLFGLPNDTNFTHFFSAWNFLQYSQGLRVIRVLDDSTSKNAGLEISNDATGNGASEKSALILNDGDAGMYTPSFSANAKLQIFAKYPGIKGNNIKVAIANSNDFSSEVVSEGIAFSSLFEYVPTRNEIALVVLFDDVIVEKYIVSLDATDVDFEGNNIYAPEFINRRSNYILVYDKSIDTDTVDSISSTALLGGVLTEPTTGDVNNGYEIFDNQEEVTINIIIDGGNNSSTIHQYIIDNLIESRKDCVAYLTCPRNDVVGVANISTAITNLVTYRKTTLARSTSYAALYGNWKYQYDQYNDKYRWVPVSGDIAGITAQTHFNRDPWFAPMGYNRGLMKNVVKLAINPKRSHRDTLQREFINPIVNDSNVGPVVLGQKTLISSPSSFSRLDVRWLFVTMENGIAAAAKYFIGEKNTDFTQRQFKGIVEPYLRDIKGRDGIEDYYIQVDDVINTAEVKSRNEFKAAIYVKPTMTAEYIILEFVNVKGSISFEEVIKKSV